MTDAELNLVQLKELKRQLGSENRFIGEKICQNAIDCISNLVEAPVKPANGVSREDKIMELLQDFWDEYNNNKAVVWLRNDNTGQLAIYTRGEYANDLIQFISRLSV